jgi:hypothetical protein
VQRAGHHVEHHRQPVDEVELLEDRRHVGAHPTHVAVEHAAALQRAPEQPHLAVAARVGTVQPVQVAQQRRLARAGGAEQRDHLPGLDPQRHAAQRGLVAEALAQGFDLDRGHGHDVGLR